MQEVRGTVRRSASCAQTRCPLGHITFHGIACASKVVGELGLLSFGPGTQKRRQAEVVVTVPGVGSRTGPSASRAADGVL